MATAMGAHKKTGQVLGARDCLVWAPSEIDLRILMDAGRLGRIGVDADVGPKLPLYQQLTSRDGHREKIAIQDFKLP
jgi:hypothetical protein